MKKAVVLIIVIGVLSFKADTPKVLKAEATLAEWQKHINKLDLIRKIADESNLPHQEVSFIAKTIDSLEMFVVPQLQKQLSDSTKKVNKK